MALIGVKVDLEHLDAAADVIAAMPQVTSIHTTLGRYDMIATVACKNLEHLNETITRDIGRLPGIRDVETFLSTRSVKILRQWQLPLDLMGTGEAKPGQ
jgi:DNA-binding Lrp family transcriptional regulator